MGGMKSGNAETIFTTIPPKAAQNQALLSWSSKAQAMMTNKTISALPRSKVKRLMIADCIITKRPNNGSEINIDGDIFGLKIKK